MKHLSLLAALCVALAGCAAQAPQPLPQVQSAPPPESAKPSPPPPAAPAPAPKPLLAPEERVRAEAVAAAALEKAIAPVRGNRDKLRIKLGISKTQTTSSEGYLADSLVRLVQDPVFPRELAASMSDAQLIQVGKHPELALDIGGDAFRPSLEQGFRGLDGGSQKRFLQVFAEYSFANTPEECEHTRGHDKNDDNTMFVVLDRLPAQSQKDFADLLVQAMRGRRGTPPVALDADEQHLVALNFAHYLDSLPEADRARLATYLRNKTPADRCWATGHIVRALLSGDDELVGLGVRLFGSNIGAHGSR